MVTRAGKYVFHGEAGYSDIETLTGFRTNTICRLLSMSKARAFWEVVCVCVARRLFSAAPFKMHTRASTPPPNIADDSINAS